MIVVDSSVFSSIIVKDEFHEQARDFISARPRRELVTVDLAYAETANTLWKHTFVLKRIPVEKYKELKRLVVPLIDNSVLRVYHSKDIMTYALDVASQYGVTVYDALYIALALRIGSKVASFDEKLKNKLAVQRLDIVVAPKP